MSTFGGGTTANPREDADLQLAPTGQAGPSFEALSESFQKCLADNQSFADQSRVNFLTRFAIWPGQSSDGKKHAREGSKLTPTPWEGASDQRVYLVDDAINSMVAMYRMAFRRASLVASPVEAGDSKRAQVVTNYMRWLIHTQIPNINREIELLANYVNEKGVAALGAFWETRQEKALVTVTLQELQAQLPDFDIMALLVDPTGAEQVAAVFEERYGVRAAKAKKMVRDLANTGTTTVAALGRKVSRPILRAFNLDENLFIPPDTTDLETAAAIYRVEYFTPEQLRGFVQSDNWDSEWVEQAIEKCRGRLITLDKADYQQSISRSFVYQQQRETTKIGVVYAYQRLSDEDGIPGIYCTVFNPSLPPDARQRGYAKFGLSPYAHGQYPFTLFRREYLSRKSHDSRGLPEPGKAWQDAIKAHIDSRRDAASISIIPPLGHPMGRPPMDWGPMARVPERRPGEFHFLDKPAADPLTETSELQLRADFKQYNGFATPEGDPVIAQTKLQNAVDKFLSGLREAFRQIWRLSQQYSEDVVYFRVSGLPQSDPIAFEKGKPEEDYDIMLEFDVTSMDSEKLQAKLEQIAKIVATADRDGIVNYAEWLRLMIESVDPVIAARIIDPVNEGHARIAKEVQDTLARAFAGQDVDLKENTPPEVAIPLIQQYVQGDPTVQQRMQNKEDLLSKRIEKLLKQAEFTGTQRENAKIGRLGA